jgi:hypothetical protein
MSKGWGRYNTGDALPEIETIEKENKFLGSFNLLP